jgi:hypothetical protein
MEDDHALKLIASIAQKLPSEDFFRFRQTCKEINSGTLPVFANRYFKTRHVMLERRSLSNLITISQHHSLVLRCIPWRFVLITSCLLKAPEAWKHPSP